MSEDKIQSTKEAMYKFSQVKTLSDMEQTILRNGANAINQLQQENEELKSNLDTITKSWKLNVKKVKELNNILTEFEKWLKENIVKMKQGGKVMKNNIFVTKDLEHTLSIRVLESALYKLQELKKVKL